LTIIKLKDVNLNKRNKILIKNLNLEIKENQSWVILGRNGAGKSTLLKSIAGIESFQGKILLFDKNILKISSKKRAKKLGLLLQQSSSGFENTALEMVLSGGYPNTNSWGFESQFELDNAFHAMKEVGIEKLMNAKIGTLSGGELRRAEISRLIMQNPNVALLDEPLNNLDLSHQSKIITSLLNKFCSPEKSILMALHDINLSLQIATHLLILKGNGEWLANKVEALRDPDLLSEYLGCHISKYTTSDGDFFSMKHKNIL